MSRTAIRIIHEEHRALAAMLRTLHLLADRIREGGGAPDFDLIRAILFYIDEFPERLHHTKETELLFPMLRARVPNAAAVLDRLDADHGRGESAIRELEHLLLAWEQLGERRRQPFLDALERYVNFYLEHMNLEEHEMLPLAEHSLTDKDWDSLDRAFEENRDPLTGHAPSEEYEALFTKIVSLAPAPIGLGGN
jgi:hemerythrin-like domain-containing protein